MPRLGLRACTAMGRAAYGPWLGRSGLGWAGAGLSTSLYAKQAALSESPAGFVGVSCQFVGISAGFCGNFQRVLLEFPAGLLEFPASLIGISKIFVKIPT